MEPTHLQRPLVRPSIRLAAALCAASLAAVAAHSGQGRQAAENQPSEEPALTLEAATDMRRTTGTPAKSTEDTVPGNAASTDETSTARYGKVGHRLHPATEAALRTAGKDDGENQPDQVTGPAIVLFLPEAQQNNSTLRRLEETLTEAEQGGSTKLPLLVSRIPASDGLMSGEPASDVDGSLTSDEDHTLLDGVDSLPVWVVVDEQNIVRHREEGLPSAEDLTRWYQTLNAATPQSSGPPQAGEERG